MHKYLTFAFLLLAGVSFSQDSKCDVLKNGYFSYGESFPETIIYREGNHQIEYDLGTGQWILLDLNWTGECRYKFTFTNGTMPNIDNMIGTVVVVNIITFDTQGYHFLSHFEVLPDEKISGDILFLEQKLSKKTERKIKKALRKNT